MSAVEYFTIGLAAAAMLARVAMFLPRARRIHARTAA
jgi:hypothetical protein